MIVSLLVLVTRLRIFIESSLSSFSFLAEIKLYVISDGMGVERRASYGRGAKAYERNE